MNLVIDCSFVSSVILPDENGIKFDFTKYRIHTPAIFFIECNSTLIKAVKRSRITEDEARQGLLYLETIPAIVDKFSTTSESCYQISKLSLAHELTPYDASYLELALRVDAKLATFDKALAKAARDSGLEVIF